MERPQEAKANAMKFAYIQEKRGGKTQERGFLQTKVVSRQRVLESFRGHLSLAPEKGERQGRVSLGQNAGNYTAKEDLLKEKQRCETRICLGMKVKQRVKRRAQQARWGLFR